MKLYRKFYQITITKVGCFVTLQSCVLAVKGSLHMADFCIWPTGTKRAGKLGVRDTITCSVSRGTDLAELFMCTELIFWDKISMQNSHNIEAVD